MAQLVEPSGKLVELVVDCTDSSGGSDMLIFLVSNFLLLSSLHHLSCSLGGVAGLLQDLVSSSTELSHQH